MRRIFFLWLFISLSSVLMASQNVKIGVLAFRSKAETLKQWTPTAEYLSRSIPGYTFTIVPMDYPQMRQAAATGTVEFIITNSGHYVYLEKLYQISRIATMMKYKNGQWIDRFGGVIFTRADNRTIENIEDLKGKKIAAVDTDSLGGYSAQMFELFQSDISNKEIALQFTGMPHDNVVNAVLSSRTDAGFVRTEVLEEMASEGKLRLKDLKILGAKHVPGFPYLLSTALYPEWPISRMPKTSQHLADQVVVALLNIPRNGSPEQGSMAWTAPLEYRSIHTIFEALRLPPYDQPERFNLADVYHRYQFFILAIALLLIIIIAGMAREFRLRQKLQILLDENIKAQAQTKLAAMVFDYNSDAIVISDLEGNGHIISVNPAFEKLTGYTIDEIRGKETNLLYSGHHDKIFYDMMWNSINIAGTWEGEIVDRNKNGSLFSKWLTIRTVYHENGQPYRRIAIFSDFTEHKEAQQKIWHQANFDLLTSLPNRNMFIYRLEKELLDLERNSNTLALMFLDLDNFKEVNDTLGHDKGDILLREAANRITSCIRKNDVVCRLGGDEFTIIFPNIKDQYAIDKIANSLLNALSQPFDLDGERAFVTVSIGITIAPDDGDSVDILLKNADQAMYSAKKYGKNQYHYFTPLMQDVLNKRRKLIIEMRDAIEEGKFVLHYQPILNLHTGLIHKAEALIRWQKEDGTLISPADFIPLAEETGMILELGKWVFTEAARQVLEWRSRFDPKFQISINASAIQFRSENGQCTNLFNLIDSGGIEADAIVIELTEGVLMEHSDMVLHTFEEFEKRGIMISIDDFGTGYSSLAYLKKFDVHILKIDQAFVRNLENDEDDKVLCEAITIMAHRLGIKVIAEGVETQEQRRYLETIDCDYIQGYLISRPIDANSFAEMFLKNGEKPAQPNI